VTRGHETRYALAALLVTIALFVISGLIAVTHIRFDARATLDAASYAMLMLGVSAIGILIVRREPRNAIGWLFCATPLLVSVSVGGGAIAVWMGPEHADIPGAAVPGWFSLWAWPIGLVGFLMLLPLLFPDGRPPAGRWRLLLRIDLAALAVIAAALMAQPGEMFNGVTNPLGVGWADSPPVVAVLGALVLILIPAGLVSAVVRYRRAGTTERVQLREVVFAAAATFVGFILISVLSAQPALYTIDYALIPAAVGLAMLRYRLYDVDFVIRRTLIYGALVVMLAALYLSGVAGLGALFRALTGLSSSVAVTISTLAVVGAFQPLRARIQRAVDRRFYRPAYDARKIVEAFSGQLREQIDLDVLADRLLATVRETVRPRAASVWLAPVTIPERASGTKEA
jgi:hypothetical protein